MDKEIGPQVRATRAGRRVQAIVIVAYHVVVARHLTRDAIMDKVDPQITGSAYLCDILPKRNSCEKDSPYRAPPFLVGHDRVRQSTRVLVRGPETDRTVHSFSCVVHHGIKNAAVERRGILQVSFDHDEQQCSLFLKGSHADMRCVAESQYAAHHGPLIELLSTSFRHSHP
jgi:hypothetical protein